MYKPVLKSVKILQWYYSLIKDITLFVDGVFLVVHHSKKNCYSGSCRVASLGDK